MNLASLSIRRPIFITCAVILMIAAGLFSMKRLGLDLFPNINFPVIFVSTGYPGAGPAEVETLVTKPIEDELSTLAGLKRLSSTSQESLSLVVAEFTLETDIKFAEQQIRDRVSGTRRRLPRDIMEPVFRRLDPADTPIMMITVSADLPPAKLYDLANEIIRPKLEQTDEVGLVEVLGGRKREIHVALDRTLLKDRDLSVSMVAARLNAAGEDIPVGKVDQDHQSTVFRTLGQFNSLKAIANSVVSFFGNDSPTRISDIGQVIDTLEDEKSRTYVNGEKSLIIYAYKQSGSNTVKVADALTRKMAQVQKEIVQFSGKPKLSVLRDGSKWVRINVDDVRESILLGVLLAVIVVYLFLGNIRSTIITGLALPNSLIGAFLLMFLAGFTINLMTLMALSLTVGLLIDDAIVVRENIFRHIEMGKPALQAAKDGTTEVTLAVIATSLTVIAVFGPVAFMKGIVGQFFREFGFTVCFAMTISLFDALTIAPMLSAYFAGKAPKRDLNGIWAKTIGWPILAFERSQRRLADRYERILVFTLKRPLIMLGAAALIFLLCMSTIRFIPKAFQSQSEAGEFAVSLDLPPGTNLDGMEEAAHKADEIIRKNSWTEVTGLVVGSNGEPNRADFFVKLTPFETRKGFSTTDAKEAIRQQLEPLKYANPVVKDFDMLGGGQRAFMVNFISNSAEDLERISQKALAYLKKNPALKDVDTSSRPGKPEFQFIPDQREAAILGISPTMIGMELRSQVEGTTPAKYRSEGLEYDIRVRLQDDQRNLRMDPSSTYVPNINNTLVKLSNVARFKETTGPAKITRQDRGRSVSISADIAPGAGIGDVMSNLDQAFTNKDKTGPDDLSLPPGMRYNFTGQGEAFQDLGSGMAMAMIFGTLFIFLVLASLYESFITPFTIILALPLAICGAILATFLAHETLNIFSWIGIILLLGVATKNAILLVDYANRMVATGVPRSHAIIQAGKIRLRPILMTTMALIAGTIPVALGLSEASKMRTSMGIAIIGGLVSSTLLTLIVVPAVYTYVDRFRVWSRELLAKNVGNQ